jgi:hypothetical protein
MQCHSHPLSQLSTFLLVPLSQPDTGATAVLVDELEHLMDGFERRLIF